MSTVVVKVGGHASGDGAAIAAIEELSASHGVVVVHGAGPQITREMERRGLEVRFVGGRRFTTPEALEIVRDAYGDVNTRLCEALGPRAVSFYGDDIGLLATPARQLGLVGDAVPSQPPAIVHALAEGLVPVVAPLAVGPLNVNADEAAAALAIGLGATRIVFCSDVPGLLRHGFVVPFIAAREASVLLAEGKLQGGMVPKLNAAVVAARRGVRAEIGQTLVSA
jgi:acetylglutamate kinase